jgi:predicted ATPase/DNA-binding CsgD family transcriptional regulator
MDGVTAASRRTKAPAARRRREGVRRAGPGSPLRRRHNLPAQLTSFIGREHEVAEITRLLETTRLLTLTGAGGSGKTRLAFQVAADLVDHYRDGVWLIELAPLSDPVFVPHVTASALAVTEQPHRPLDEIIADHLREKSVLLIFDNCEHVLQRCSALVDILLRACPAVHVLATSREALRIAGEVTWRVPPLSLPEASRTGGFEHLLKYESVRLFVDRAAAVAGFTATPEIAGTVARICRRLDGIPLAIELAAARVRALSVEQIAARLDDRFALLTDGDRTAPPRQRTLQAAIDWSHELLSEPERTAFRRLSVFADGWTLEAAEAVCADGGIAPSQVLGLLTQLIDKSLVIADTRGDTRYRFLETIRQYASDRLAESHEGSDVRTRHRDWYLHLAERADGALWAGQDQEAWLERLETEFDNLRNALAWSRVARDGGEPLLRLAASLMLFWVWQDHYREGLAWLEQALSVTGAERIPARAQTLCAAAFLALVQDDSSRAAAWAEQSVAVWREIGNAAELGRCLRVLALAVHYQGDVRRARTLAEEGVAICREAGDAHGVYATLNILGGIASNQKDYAAARAAYEESLALARSFGNDIRVAIVASNLGAVALYQNDIGRARDLLIQALRAGKPAAFKQIRAMCLVAVSRLAAILGQSEEAARLSGAAEGVQTALGGTFLLPATRTEHERSMAAVRRTLGEAAFNAATAEGQAMTLEQALEHAMSVVSSPPTPVSDKRPTVDAASHGPLTRREREVAILIAQGLSNRAIASRLFISERTAETHVQHIFTKLGLEARTQIAAWVAQRGLMPSSGHNPTDAGPPA